MCCSEISTRIVFRAAIGGSRRLCGGDLRGGSIHHLHSHLPGVSVTAGGIVGISIDGITGIAVTTGTTVSTGTAVAVYVGLGRVMEAHRFSCVDVGAGKNAALAGEAAKEKRITPMQATSMTSNRPEVEAGTPGGGRCHGITLGMAVGSILSFLAKQRMPSTTPSATGPCAW